MARFKTVARAQFDRALNIEVKGRFNMGWATKGALGRDIARMCLPQIAPPAPSYARTKAAQAIYCVLIVFSSFSLHGCMPLTRPPQLFDLDTLPQIFPRGANGRDLDKELVSRGFVLSNNLASPHHDASFQFDGILVSCLARVQWDEDQAGKIAADLRIIYPCAGL